MEEGRTATQTRTDETVCAESQTKSLTAVGRVVLVPSLQEPSSLSGLWRNQL